MTPSEPSRGTIVVLSGPNLDLLGERQPAVYGTATLADHVATAAEAAAAHGFALEHTQSNHEGDLIEAIHAARGNAAAIVINAAALTHYAWALHDALASFDGPSIELHISNPAAREPFRHTSVLAGVVSGAVIGFGGLGYRLAIDAAVAVLDERAASM